MSDSALAGDAAHAKRKSGRTTRMLVEAVEHARAGREVYVEVHSGPMVECVRDALGREPLRTMTACAERRRGHGLYFAGGGALFVGHGKRDREAAEKRGRSRTCFVVMRDHLVLGEM